VDETPRLTRRSRRRLAALVFLAGIGAGGYLFSDSQPRSFLALANCGTCYRANDLAGLIASVGIARASIALPRVVKETDRCVAIEHPFPEAKVHFVVFPKKDMRSIADISIDDQPYLFNCLAVIRALVLESGLRDYRVETNGPGLQKVTYLHFHVVSGDARRSVDPPTMGALR
jgi:histidine triad (HIT) family protein